MPRSSKVEACMLCEAVPCECFSSAPRKRAAKVQPIEVEPPALKKPSGAQAAMRAAAAVERIKEFEVQYLSPPRPRISRATGNPEDLVFADAVRALGSILHPIEKEKYSMILNTSPSVDARAASWRARHG